MFRSKNSIASYIFAFTIIFFQSLSANEETIIPNILRTVVLNFTIEPHAIKYTFEITDLAKKKTEQFESNVAKWEGKLPLGHYRSRFKIKFKDETESNWSDFLHFKVDHYKFNFVNIDNSVGRITTVNKKKLALLKWNAISDIKSYKVIYRPLETFEIIEGAASKPIKRNKVFKVAAKEKDLLTANEAELEIEDSGVYEIKLIAKDAESKTIGFYTETVEFYDADLLKPYVIPPVNNFVREIKWTPMPGSNVYKISVYFLIKDGLTEKLQQVHHNKLHQGASYTVPLDWPGGVYRFCAATFIKSKTYSNDGCLNVLIKDDRSQYTESKHYQEIIQQQLQQYYHHFNFITSTIDYTSFNPSRLSSVDLKGQVLNFSYTKSEPSRFEDVNLNYRLNLGLINIENKLHPTYEFRYGGEYSYFNFYPYILKGSGGIGLNKAEQALTDVTAQSLTIASHHILNFYTTGTFRYDFINKFAIDFKVSYIKPFFQVLRTNNNEFSKGESIEYSISGSGKGFRPNDRFEVGYLFKSTKLNFKPEASGFDPSYLRDFGHYLSIGYIMESK